MLINDIVKNFISEQIRFDNYKNIQLTTKRIKECNSGVTNSMIFDELINLENGNIIQIQQAARSGKLFNNRKNWIKRKQSICRYVIDILKPEYFEKTSVSENNWAIMRSTDIDTHTAIVYGEYKPSNWYVNGIATYGWSDYSEDKNVAGVGVKADYDVETFGLQAMTGYDMNINGFGVTPEAGLRYVHIKQDAYKDSADQKVSGNDSDILTGVIGAKVSKFWELENGMNIKPEVRVAATYDLMNDDVNSVVTLANGSAYAVEGEALDRFGMEFGAGVTAEVNDNVELSLGYEGKFREDYQDHTGLINAKYKF